MPTDAHPPLQSQLTLAQLAREQRLQVIVRKGLPPFRQTALELTKVLGGASPDLKKAGKLIATDPTLSSQVLRMCNSPLLGMHSRVISIDHAAILLGPERLRNLALTTSVADFAGKVLPDLQMSAFWEHSFMTAMLSQFLAERWKYFEKHQAYIAGLLHDIGQIPEWMLLSEGAEEPDAAPSDWVDNISVEQEYFGTDHCKLGVIMARSWGLMPSFLDVLENHHTPELAQRDSVLVRIVATADCFLLTKAQALPSPESGRLFEPEVQQFAHLGQGLFGDTEWPHVEKALEQEYARTLPIAMAGLNGLLGRSNGDSEQKPAGDSRPALQQDRDADLRFPQPSSQAAPPQTQSSVRTARSGPTTTTFISRCKSFIRQLFS
jgi:putative nucleotidyltransferase with HDIG domain